MSARVYCPHCGAEMPEGAPQGLCPKCLLAAGLVGDSVTGAPRAGSQSPTTPHSTGFTPLEPSALRPHFPQLEIVELLGHGGMGAIYKARQPKLDRLVALKVMRLEAADDPSFAERFNREARLLARLSHPNIVTVYDFGSVTIPLSEMNRRAEREGHTELFFFLMEYVEGANLRELMQGGKFSPEQGLAIVPQLCDALQFAHDEGVVHRDIKPENILLDQRGRVKIADFGLAKLVGPAEDFELTATHQVMGTPRYMAPEQMAGSHSVDHRADIYSLGVVLYEMLTGEVPAGHFDPPSKKVEIDVRLDEVVLRALAREPERRYQHASDVKTDVESISASQRLASISPATGDAVDGDEDGSWKGLLASVVHIFLAVVVSMFGLGVFLGGADALRPLGIASNGFWVPMMQFAGLFLLIAALMSLAYEWKLPRRNASGLKSEIESISQTLRQGKSSGGAVSNAAEVRPPIDRPSRNASTLLPKLPLATSLLTLVVAVFGIGVPFISWAGVLNPSNTTHFARGFGWWQGMLVCFSFAATLFVLIATLPWRRIPMWRPVVIALAGVLVLASACSFIVQETNGSLPVQPLLDAASWGIEINGRTPTTVIEANVVTDIASGPYVAIGLASMLLLIAALETAVVAYGDRSADAASAPHGAPAGRNRFAGSVMSELAATGHKWRRQHSRDQEQSAAVARPPFGFGFAIAGLFGIGWVVVGAMRHFGWPGFLLGILVMAAITYGVLRWRLRYLPELRAELSRQSPLAQGIGAAAGMIFFLLGMLALNRFVADARDAYYFSSHSLQPSGAVRDYQYGIGTPKEKQIAIPDARSNSDGEDSLTIESIDDRTCLHQPRRVPFLWGAPYAVAGVVLLLASVATVLGTRAYQYRWALHLRPALYVTIVMLLMLPVVVIANSTAPEMAGFGEHWLGTIPPISLCVESDITKTLVPIVDAWAKNNGYTGGITPGATGGMSHGDAGWSIERGDWENSYDLEYRSWDLKGTSALDRCQFIWGGVIRPRPPITVTWLKQSMGRVDQEPHVQTIVLAEFPWASNAELELWRPMMDSLQQAISRAASLEGGVPSIAPVSPTTAHVDTIASIVAIVLVAIAIGVALLYRRQHSTSNLDSDVPPRVRLTLGRAWDDWWADRDRWLTNVVQLVLCLMFLACFIMFLSFHWSSEPLSIEGAKKVRSITEFGWPGPWLVFETHPSQYVPFRWKINWFSSSGAAMLLGFLAVCVNWQIEKAKAETNGTALRWWHGSPAAAFGFLICAIVCCFAVALGSAVLVP